MLLLILVVPFLVKLKFGAEPYPAIILPSGAGKTVVGADELRIKYTALFAKEELSDWIRVSPANLLYPIPVQYSPSIILSEFGLKDEPEPIGASRISRLLIKLKFLKSRNSSEEEQKEVKAWLRGRLQKEGYSPVLRVVQVEEIVSTISGEILKKETKHEKIIQLDQ